MATESKDTTPAIVKLRAADLAQLETLLRENQLPVDDCAAQLPAFSGVFDAARLIAAGGLELTGRYGLLRSVIVDEKHRGRGLARTIMGHLVDEARQRQLLAIFLLTETAEDYFARFGFARVDREAAPEPIRHTRQFAALCPDSAVLMRLPLKPR